MRWHLPERLDESVRSELGRFGPAGAIADVVAAWPGAVGDAISANAWPARIGRDGTLTVTTSSSVWSFELTKLEARIRGQLEASLGGAAPPRIRFVPGRLPERGAESVPMSPQTPPEVAALARQAGAEIAASIDDEELRELVARAATASLARRYGRSADR